MKAEVLSKADEIGGWATVKNYSPFRAELEKYFNRSGTEFSRAYYRVLRYSFAEAILEHLEAERPEHLPAIPSERPTGYYDMREVVRWNYGEAILEEILALTRGQYVAGLETDGGMPPTYISRCLLNWQEALEAGLNQETLELKEFGDYLEGRYDEYYEAITIGRCGRTRLKNATRIEEITLGVYEGRHHAEFVEEYELGSDEPDWAKEMMTDDGN